VQQIRQGPMAARRLFSAFSTFAEPSSSTTCCTSGGANRCAGGGAATGGAIAPRAARWRPISAPMNVPISAPKPNATQSSMGTNLVQAGARRRIG